jgi:hypothetical protein
MKSLTLIRTFILCAISILLLTSCFVQSIKIEANKQVNLRSSQQANNSTDAGSANQMRSPIIDANRQIGDKKFEKVVYVKQISAAGKAALELRNSGE